MSHTPGPWMVDCISDDFDGAIDIVSNFTVDADGRRTANWIAACDLQDDRIEENHANAHLIAAAPELLQLVREALQSFEEFRGATPGDHVVDLRDWMQTARAALAKAEGR